MLFRVISPLLPEHTQIFCSFFQIQVVTEPLWKASTCWRWKSQNFFSFNVIKLHEDLSSSSLSSAWLSSCPFDLIKLAIPEKAQNSVLTFWEKWWLRLRQNAAAVMVCCSNISWGIILLKCNSGSLTASFLKRVCSVSNCSTITNYNDLQWSTMIVQIIIF